MSIKSLKPRKDSHFLQGYFTPVNRNKYVGNPSQIIYRSSYELMIFIILDLDPKILRWNSEGVVIKYYYPVDKKEHRYYLDVYFEKEVNGKIVKILGEIKAEKFVTPPKNISSSATLKQKRTHYKEKAIFVKNMCKKAAAEKFAAERGMSYQIYHDQFFKKFELKKLQELHSSKLIDSGLVSSTPYK